MIKYTYNFKKMYIILHERCSTYHFNLKYDNNKKIYKYSVRNLE